MTADNNNNQVLIIGAGISGLTLANVLQYHNVPYQLFERDVSQEIRPQGWSLTLHFSLNTLRRAMDPTKFATLGTTAAVDPSHPQAAPFAIVDGNTGERKTAMGTNPNRDAIRLNRKRLRHWLLQDVNVTWNKAFESYQVTNEGVQVRFTDGTMANGRIVVGADGVNSRVCRQLIGPSEFEKTTVRLPVQALACSYWIGKSLRKQIEERFSSAYMTATANPANDTERTTCLFSSLTDVDINRDDPYDTLWSISCVSDDPPLSTDMERLEQARKWVREAQFEKTLEQLVANTPDGTKVIPLHMRERPPHLSLETYQGPVALIGDAAHVLAHYRGNGGNHAVQDAATLGLLLRDVYNNGKPLQNAINEYNAEMVPRGRKAVGEARVTADILHGPRSGVIAMVNAIAAQLPV